MIKKSPEIDAISDAVRVYNGEIARWKGKNYLGRVPQSLLDSSYNLYQVLKMIYDKEEAVAG